jgi:ubiquinol-cytochrome c reductase cytochrome c subunit
VRVITKLLLPLGCLLLSSSVLAVAAQDAVSEETLEFFQNNCASCHTIVGGRLAGPDLKGVTERREHDWLVAFVRDPKAMFESGDAYALKILSEANGVPMPTLPAVTKELAEKLVDLIRIESALEKSHFVGLQLDDRALTAADVQRGRDLFMGVAAFEAGAPPCASCHTVAGLGGFGGGLLGPDLTSAYGRLEGRKALGAWLAAPPSAVMQPVFKNHGLESEEILALVAVMKDAAESGAGEAESSTLSFVLSAIAVAAGLMVLFDILWRNRFRSVRRTLVENS